ncbi:hypothetical protein WJX72_006865 [[Myrmecia] bisecta]|uniref:cellulase n=1 Tax=[Myrmecia] bisecta TaxID=41462 RepID=A0AAW1P0T6_9CHLO
MFVAYNIRVGGRGFLDSQTAAAILTPAARQADPSARMFTITQGAWEREGADPILFNITVQVPKMTDEQNERILQMLNMAHARCPFSATFGVKGLGEGIVWVPTDPNLARDPGLWFKTVHPVFQTADRLKKERNLSAKAVYKQLDEWVAASVTDNRLEQGFNALQTELATGEGSHTPTKADARWLIDWVYNDTVKEEADSLPEGFDPETDSTGVGAMADQLNTDLWVLDYLLDQDQVKDELIKHYYDGFLTECGQLPPLVQTRLMLRVLRDNSANITDSSLNALNCLTTYSREDPALYPPFTRITDISPSIELYLQVKTELVLQGFRAEAAQVVGQSPQQLLDQYFPASEPEQHPLQLARRNELQAAINDPAARQALLDKYPLPQLTEDIKRFVEKGRAALGLPLLKVVEEDRRQGKYLPFQGQYPTRAGYGMSPGAHMDAVGQKRGRPEDSPGSMLSNLQAHSKHLKTLGGSDPLPQVLHHAGQVQQAAYHQAYAQNGEFSQAVQAALLSEPGVPTGEGGSLTHVDAHGRQIYWNSPENVGGRMHGEAVGALPPLEGGPDDFKSPMSTEGKKKGGPRRKIGRWSEEETNELIRLVREHGKGRWRKILDAGEQTFANRSQVDLKDKWRNLERQGLTGGIPVEPSLRQRKRKSAAGEGLAEGQEGVPPHPDNELPSPDGVQQHVGLVQDQAVLDGGEGLHGGEDMHQVQHHPVQHPHQAGEGVQICSSSSVEGEIRLLQAQGDSDRADQAAIREEACNSLKGSRGSSAGSRDGRRMQAAADARSMHSSRLGGEDLSKGYYEAGGSYMKVGLPNAFLNTQLAWAAVAFDQGLAKVNELKETLEAIRWGADYLISCHSAPERMVALLGNKDDDFNYYGPPEYYDEYVNDGPRRNVTYITLDDPGSEIAGEAAAALAAASVAFKGVDANYSATCLQHAKQLYAFARKMNASFMKSQTPGLQAHQLLYPSTGFHDELAWAAVWLYKATNNSDYLTDAQDLYPAAVGDSNYACCGFGVFGWDTKTPGINVLLAQLLPAPNKYIDAANQFFSWYLPGKSRTVPHTDNGLQYPYSGWGSCRFGANTAFLAAVHASTLRANADTDTANQIFTYGVSQVNFVLGDSNRSYMVGFGQNWPLRSFQKSARNSWMTFATAGQDSNAQRIDFQGDDGKTTYEPNRFIAYGAVVGGPFNITGNYYNDTRKNYQFVEPSTDFGSGLVGVLAAYVDYFDGLKPYTDCELDLGWSNPNATARPVWPANDCYHTCCDGKVSAAAPSAKILPGNSPPPSLVSTASLPTRRMLSTA